MTLPVFETPRLIVRSITEHDAEVGWIVVPSCWRQGLMMEAAPPVISHCFTRLNAHRIAPENVSSRRLAAKLRFTEEGLLRAEWS
jgi:RimJ/RimL family protein N-acetyltransferase